MRISVAGPAAVRLLVISLCVFPAHAQALTLAEAEQLALRNNSGLAAARAAVDVAAGQAVQAGLLHDPELSVLRENMGNASLTGLDGPSTTWQLSQRFEVNGQHEARSDAARRDVLVSAAGLAVQQRQLLGELRVLWIEALAAGQRVALATDLARATEATRAGVAAQVRAGKVSPVALSRLDVASAALLRKERQAAVALALVRQQLATMIGRHGTDPGDTEGQLPARSALPDMDVLLAAAPDNPLLREAEARVAASASRLELERASRVPDITVSVGQRQYEEVSESAWQVGVSLPIPFFNRNQGAILAADARLLEARALAAGRRQAWRDEISALHARLAALDEHLTRLEGSALPASESAFNAVSKGFRFGKFGLLDVLDAQRSHIDTRFDYLDTLVDYHRQRARLDALTSASTEKAL